MYTIYLKDNKTLLASKKDALALMEVIEKKTGERPQVIEERKNTQTKPDFYFMR